MHVLTVCYWSACCCHGYRLIIGQAKMISSSKETRTVSCLVEESEWEWNGKAVVWEGWV